VVCEIDNLSEALSNLGHGLRIPLAQAGIHLFNQCVHGGLRRPVYVRIVAPESKAFLVSEMADERGGDFSLGDFRERRLPGVIVIAGRKDWH
jgi:hypothetical protein